MSSYPYALLGTLPPTGWTFYLQVSDELAGERGQQMRVKQLGPDLWAARYSSNQMKRDLMRQLKAIVHALLSQRETFFAWDPMGQYPADDPTGSKLGAAQPLINSVNANNQQISLKGLPPAYKLTYGDYISFDYGGARAFHQIIPPTGASIANGSGITPEFWVAPRIRLGWSMNLPVLLLAPLVEMMIVPGSFQSDETPFNASISFDAIQVLP
jgi:hypothetical protein